MTLEEKRARQREYSRRYRDKNPEKVTSYNRSDGRKQKALEHYYRNREMINTKRRAKRWNKIAAAQVTVMEIGQKVNQWLEEYNKLFER